MSNITIIKSKLNRGLELTQQESWELYKYIKALEQQPSDDCISREAVMKCFKKWQPYMATRLWDYEQELKDLPSVTSQQKMGRWINNKCDKCGASRPPLFDNYCPNCGAKMEVEE